MNFTAHKNPSQNKLTGRVALITGASKRMGRAIALALAEEGVHIVAHDRRKMEKEVISVCNDVKKCGSKSWNIMADLERPEQYSTLILQSIKIAGSLQILINNASLFLPSTLGDVGFNDVIRHIHVNAWAPLVLSREFARLARHGTIINLLDTKIVGYDKTHVAYNLSKKLFCSLTSLCAVEFFPHITVNGVAPGLILPPEGKDENYLNQLAQFVPLRHHGDIQDITDVVLYLSRSRFVTGQIIYVDGGRHLLEDLYG